MGNFVGLSVGLPVLSVGGLDGLGVGGLDGLFVGGLVGLSVGDLDGESVTILATSWAIRDQKKSASSKAFSAANLLLI